MSYNLLILSAGRRVELIECFRNAAKRLNVACRIVAVDCSDTAPALYFADGHHLVPRVSDPAYIDAIIEICVKENISLIVPTIDTELILLSKNKAFIEESTRAKVLVSDEKVIKICRDKFQTQRFFTENNFGAPRLYTKEQIENGDLVFPVFIKPKDGSSSVSAYKVNSLNELRFYMDVINQPIVQEYVSGKEYTVDVFLDFNKNVITAVPRLRIAVRSGEILKGRIEKNREIIGEVCRMMETLGAIGQVTVQCIQSETGIKYIEINPRFGGGAPMSIYSGADSCERLFRLLMGEKLEYSENYSDNQLYLRYDRTLFVDEIAGRSR